VEVTSSHSKNPALGWDVTASAKSASGETISRAQVLVNNVSKYDTSFNPPINTWQEQLTQQGNYPGDNEVRVVVTNQKAEQTESVDSWS
jgi:hypothetical protein